MNQTNPNLRGKPWREVLQIGSSTPDRETINERYWTLTRQAWAKLDDEEATIRRAMYEGLKELSPEHV